MKRSLIDRLPEGVPDKIRDFVEGAQIYDSSSSGSARVYFIDKDEGYYLKSATSGMLAREAEMTKYYHSLGWGARVLDYISEGGDFLLVSRVPGEDCIHPDFLREPKRLTDTVAIALRRLHETDFSACPIKDRTAEYVSLAEENYRTGNYDSSHFPDSFGYRSADEAIRALREGRELLRCDTLIHGDYCLPNIMLDNWRLSGFIDVGCGGVGDRHIDIFWALWSLAFNLGTDSYTDRFLDAYGRDRVDMRALRTVAAVEVFG